MVAVIMNDFILIYIATLTFICVLVGLLLVYRYFLGNRLNQQANKLKSQMANLKQTFPELQEKRGEMVASAIGELGVDGIMQELGIDPKLLNNPLVKGLIDKYAPKLLERLGESNTSNTTNKETNLL